MFDKFSSPWFTISPFVLPLDENRDGITRVRVSNDGYKESYNNINQIKKNALDFDLLENHCRLQSTMLKCPQSFEGTIRHKFA